MTMIRRVIKNNNGYIVLDSDMYGKRCRLSTGVKHDVRHEAWYKAHFEKSFTELYERKHGKIRNALMPTFKEYGYEVMMMTSNERTIESQRDAMAMFDRLCLTFGDMPLNEIKASDIMKWQSVCGYASKTVGNYRSYIGIILKTAYLDELINRNPIELVKKPKHRDVVKKVFYSAEEMNKIIEHSTGHIKNILQFAAYTGLRGGEIIALSWDDVDFKEGCLIVEHAIREGRMKLTKSEKIRRVPLFKPALQALKNQQRKTGLKNKSVFLNQYGNPFQEPEAISRAMKRACVKADVEIGTLHDLRRSFNTLLKQVGYPEDFVLDIVGNVKGVNRKHYTGNLTVDISKLDKFAL